MCCCTINQVFLQKNGSSGPCFQSCFGHSSPSPTSSCVAHLQEQLWCCRGRFTFLRVKAINRHFTGSYAAPHSDNKLPEIYCTWTRNPRPSLNTCLSRTHARYMAALAFRGFTGSVLFFIACIIVSILPSYWEMGLIWLSFLIRC